jgi:hypothetical protein
VLELEGHRAFGAHVAAVLAEGVAHIGHVRTRLSVMVSTMMAAPPMP